MEHILDLSAPRIKGADLSTLPEVEKAGGLFFDEATGNRQQATGDAGKAFPLGGRCHRAAPASPMTDEGASQQEDALVILKRHGMNLVRLRLWNDPCDPDGTPYGGGTSDLPRVLEMARRCKALGLPWLLDLHYSDFWADPGKQFPPKAWAGYDAEGLARAVYDFTRETLETLKAEELLPAIVAVGNEITNGILWPLGKVPEWPNLVRFLAAGLRAVREAAPSARTMLHLDNGGNRALYAAWFDSWFAYGGPDFDCIGLSYYPIWHGTLEELRENLHALAARFGKPLLVTESSAAFTLADCSPWEGLEPGKEHGLVVGEAAAAKVPYPPTPEGQCEFLRELWAVSRSVPRDLGRGLVWWEPAWLPVPGVGWTTPAGLAYIGETGACGNQWANQCMFDYDGRGLPVLETLEKLI